jgi:drug/metabolite transporter (DMT)-like permease
LKKPYCKFILSLLLFGSNGIVASYISLSSYEIVLLRTLIGSLLLITIFFLTHQPVTFLRNKRDLIFLAVSGAAMGASWIFLFEAYQQVGVSIATMAYYCGPVIVMALSPLLFRERLTWPKLVGFAAVLLGAFFINGQALSEGKNAWGLLCGGMSAVMYAVMLISNKKAKGIPGLENSMLQLVVSFLTVAVFVGCRQGFVIRLAPGDWIPILLLGLVNTGIGCYLYFSSIGYLPVQRVAICGYLDPLSAVIFSALLLKETMLPVQILGAALILGGALFGELADHHGQVRPLLRAGNTGRGNG